MGLVSRFADYRKDEPSTFSLIPEFSMYPQFMYHLRRSHFLQTFNASPDETAYHRTLLQRECVMNSLVMIQPALLEYSFDEGPPKPVLLDASSLKPNVILVLDTFFLLVIWRVRRSSSGTTPSTRSRLSTRTSASFSSRLRMTA